MFEDRSWIFSNCRKNNDNTQNGTPKGGAAAEGRRPPFGGAAEGRPLYLKENGQEMVEKNSKNGLRPPWDNYSTIF